MEVTAMAWRKPSTSSRPESGVPALWDAATREALRRVWLSTSLWLAAATLTVAGAVVGGIVFAVVTADSGSGPVAVAVWALAFVGVAVGGIRLVCFRLGDLCGAAIARYVLARHPWEPAISAYAESPSGQGRPDRFVQVEPAHGEQVAYSVWWVFAVWPHRRRTPVEVAGLPGRYIVLRPTGQAGLFVARRLNRYERRFLVVPPTELRTGLQSHLPRRVHEP